LIGRCNNQILHAQLKDFTLKGTSSSLSDIVINAPIVMAQRMSRMMLPEAMKTAGDFAEDRRMVEEKSAAAVDGIVAANIEFGRQMMNAWICTAFGKMQQPMKFTDAIAEAALRPMRAKVKANVKRLGKRAN
jgi:hypothetical protein